MFLIKRNKSSGSIGNTDNLLPAEKSLQKLDTVYKKFLDFSKSWKRSASTLKQPKKNQIDDSFKINLDGQIIWSKLNEDNFRKYLSNLRKKSPLVISE